jgi:hypothetical protein
MPSVTVLADLIKKYWRETIIVLLLVTGGVFFKVYRNAENARSSAETQVQNAKVDLEIFKSGIAQAKNELVSTHKQLMESLSQEFQKELKDQKISVLATIKTEMQLRFDEWEGTGTEETPNVFTYHDKTMHHITVDAVNPAKPKFNYQLNPMTLTLEGSLGFDATNGQTKFWTLPRVSGPDGATISVGRMNFTPGPEFNAWVSEIRGKKVYVPVMPKWTAGVMAGREWASEFPGGMRNVYGLDLQRNFTTGVGIGGGFLGSTVFVKGTYSFGK